MFSFHFSRAFIVLSILLALSSAATAADTQGLVLELGISKPMGNMALIRLDKPPSTPISCSINGYWHYTVPLVSELDKRVFALLVAAQATGKPVSIAGAGACNEFGAIESAAGLILKTQ